MGRPKAWLPVGDELMLQRVVRVVGSVVEPVVVVAAVGQDVPPLPAAVRIVRDEVEGKGPLAGLAAGLVAVGDAADAVYLSACDVPFLTPAFIERLIALLGDAAAAVPRMEGHYHPLAAVYRNGVLPVVNELLAADRLRLTDLFDRVPTRVVDASELVDWDSLKNVNTWGEYRSAISAR
jgi:molybdopterin-guanine dinucleotide biosynthesis protein A